MGLGPDSYKNYQGHIGNFSNINNCKKRKETHEKFKMDKNVYITGKLVKHWKLSVEN